MKVVSLNSRQEAALQEVAACSSAGRPFRPRAHSQDARTLRALARRGLVESWLVGSHVSWWLTSRGAQRIAGGAS